MQQKMKALLQNALEKLGVTADEIHIEHPTNFLHGDYSTNVAMQYAPRAKKKPKELAKEIIRYIVRNIPKEIERVEVAGPGFINFFLSKEFFADSLKNISKQNETFGENKLLENKKVIIEYTDPNPFKEFHIGHLMSNAIGESISRIVEFSGAEVKRANYQGDVGMHIAYAVAQMEEEFDAVRGTEGYRKDNNGKYLSYEELGRKIFATYAKGAKRAREDKKFLERVREINKKIYDKSDKKINLIYEGGREISLYYFEVIYDIIGMKKLENGKHFNFYFFESESGSVGLEIVKKRSDIFKESDGATVFHGEEIDPTLHTRVFVTREGLPTYEAKELGLAQIKYDKYPYDVSLVVTGNEVEDYFRVVHGAMEQIFPELAKKTKHISHGMMRLSTGKMSSRTGDVITAEWLSDHVMRPLKRKITEGDFGEKTVTSTDYSFQTKDINEVDQLAQKIAIASIKYAILKQQLRQDQIFYHEKFTSFEGDSGPYLQYTHARARSVIEKAKEAGIKVSIKKPLEAITETERLLYQFPEIIERALSEYEPHHIATYLIQLASAFNHFYAKERIVDGGEFAPYRLAIVEAVSIVLKNGLWLLGIEAPEKM